MSTNDALLTSLREQRKAAQNLMVSDKGHDLVNRAREIEDLDERIQAVENGEPRCRNCGSDSIVAWYRQWISVSIDLLGIEGGFLRWEYGDSGDSGDIGEDEEYVCSECGLTSGNLDYMVGLTDQERTAREEVEQYAGLVFNIGTIIEDRDGGKQPSDGPLWTYLADHMSEFYDQIGPLIDRVEDEVFGDIREEDE